jgi:hypothetical protein
MHLAWACPEAQQFWAMYVEKWGRTLRPGPVQAGSRNQIMRDLLSFTIPTLPMWLVKWGKDEEITEWAEMHKRARELWQLGVAVVVTAIWRRNIDRGYPGVRKLRTIEDNMTGAMEGVTEAYARYRWKLFPVTHSTLTAIRTAEAAIRSGGASKRRRGAQTIT